MPNYLFIDGAYLHKNFGSQMQAFYGLVPQIDFQILAGSLEAERTYYYDAIDYTKASGEGQGEYDTRISEKEALHEHQGRWQVQEQRTPQKPLKRPVMKRA